MEEYRHRSYGHCVKNLPHSCIAKVKNLANPAIEHTAFWYCIYDLLYGPCTTNYYTNHPNLSEAPYPSVDAAELWCSGSSRMARQRAMEAWLVPGMWVESAGIAVEVSVSARSSWCRRSAKVGKRRQMWRWVWLESPNWKWGSFRGMSDMWYCPFLEVLVSFFQGIQTASEVVRQFILNHSATTFFQGKDSCDDDWSTFFGLPNTEIQLLIYVFFVFFQDSWGIFDAVPRCKVAWLRASKVAWPCWPVPGGIPQWTIKRLAIFDSSLRYTPRISHKNWGWFGVVDHPLYFSLGWGLLSHRPFVLRVCLPGCSEVVATLWEEKAKGWKRWSMSSVIRMSKAQKPLLVEGCLGMPQNGGIPSTLGFIMSFLTQMALWYLSILRQLHIVLSDLMGLTASHYANPASHWIKSGELYQQEKWSKGWEKLW